MRPSFRKFGDDLKCAEIGVHSGDNAIEMLNTLTMAQFYLVDSYDTNSTTFQHQGVKLDDNQRNEFVQKVKEKFAPFKDRAVLMIEDSAIASRKFANGFFDYIYIDAQHDCCAFLRDLVAWFPKLKEGGMIAGHDIDCQGVREGLALFFNTGWTINGDDWYVRKGGNIA